MHIKNPQDGFALLEVLLAILIMGVASFGVYSLYERSQNAVSQEAVKQQIVSVSTVFNELSSAHLTQPLNGGYTHLWYFLYAMNVLPSRYFKIDEASGGAYLVNAYGTVESLMASPSQIMISVPTGIRSYPQRQSFCVALKAYVTACTPLVGPDSDRVSVTIVAGS